LLQRVAKGHQWRPGEFADYREPLPPRIDSQRKTKVRSGIFDLRRHNYWGKDAAVSNHHRHIADFRVAAKRRLGRRRGAWRALGAAIALATRADRKASRRWGGIFCEEPRRTACHFYGGNGSHGVDDAKVRNQVLTSANIENRGTGGKGERGFER